ncbi:MAG: hypothetical protein JWM58_194 [Rhizobium sp.]|nr:hypothetical protein [Rhizobium sp.]
MSDKIKKVYDALIDGAEAGLSDNALFKHVLEECPKASSKKIVKASLLALSDPNLKDANILHVIYALAIKHRLDPATKEDIEEIEEPVVEAMPQVKKGRNSKKSESHAAV